ncbi:MAG: MlaD family protein [Acidobacteria bacterium]|jgi:phospholipid/cholesterol/gamma-HCH transport system substrate-binding protein|nr:MlaD family protein [Acidobacteriota bacterium]
MPARKSTQDLLVGLTVAAGLTLLAIAILVIGGQSKLFSKKYGYRTTFAEASGLRVGAPVTLAGVRVGNVTEIVLPKDPRAEGIEVEVEIDAAYAPRVREGSVARLSILQFVANEKAVEISPGNPEKPQLPDGAVIPVAEGPALLERGATIAESIERITGDLEAILGAIRRGEGVLGRAIVDPRFGAQGVEDLQATIASLRALSERVTRGQGLAGRLFSDDAAARETLADLRTAAHGLAAFGTRLERGEGLAGELTSGDSNLVSELRETVVALREAVTPLARGDGLLGRLVRDEELSGRVTTHLDETLANLASITRKIDQGQGTLGLLVNDRALHDEVETVITGVKSSKFASGLIQRYYRKGTKEQERSGHGPAPGPPPAAAAPAPAAGSPDGRRGPGGASPAGPGLVPPATGNAPPDRPYSPASPPAGPSIPLPPGRPDTEATS